MRRLHHIKPSGIARLLCSCLLWLAVQPTVYAECIKHVAWADSVPYLYKANDGSVHGLHADLIRETLKRMNCQVDFVEMPWARSLVELKEGRVDMLAGVADTSERKVYALFSRPTNQARNVLFIRQELARKFTFKRLADVIGTDFRLGVTYKAMYGGDYDTLVDNPAFAERLVQVTDRMNAWKMMAIGRLDGKLEDELTGLFEIKRQKLDNVIVRSDLAISSAPDYLAFSRKTTTPDFVAQFDRALTGMIADGSYTRIFESNVNCKVSLTTLGCEGGLKF